MQKLRTSVEQILTAAAEEIFGVFKRSIAEIGEKLSDSSVYNERNQRPPDAVHQTVDHADIVIPPEQQEHIPRVDQEDPEPPHIKEDQEEEQAMELQTLSECPTHIQNLWMVKEELEQEERSPSLDQVDPELTHIKEEEDLWTNQEGEQLQGLEEADITKFSSTPPLVKSEYDEDKAQTSQLHQSQTEENTEEPEDGDDYEGSEPDTIQNNDITISNVTCRTTHRYTEDDKKRKFSSVSETQMTDNTTQRPFNCSVCKKKCSRKFNSKRHMSLHTGERPFRCSVCHRGFALKSYLNVHMSVHTAERPYSCSVCNKGFFHRCHLKDHMSIHTVEKPFSCSVCKKGFAQKDHLKYHMFNHSGGRPFSCSVCAKGFANIQILKRHINSHRKEGFHPLSL